MATSSTDPGSDFPDLGALIQSTWDQVDDAGNIPTGFAELDEVTTGLPRGSLTVIGSHPGVGSSTLALDIARSAAIRHGIPAAYLTLDDTAERITQRVLSAEAKVKLSDLRSRRMSDDDWTRLARRASEIQESPLVITRPTSREITMLVDQIEDLVTHKQVGLVVVDSLHLVTARSALPYENREREVAEVTRVLKQLALDNDIAVVTTAQLSANPGPRMPSPPAPTLADLRDSGTVAHVADYVVLLYRPDAWERHDPRGGEADLILAKNRHGPTRTCIVAHQLHLCRFVDMARG
jgi:replicative DNA helicase